MTNISHRIVYLNMDTVAGMIGAWRIGAASGMPTMLTLLRKTISMTFAQRGIRQWNGSII